MRIQDVELQTGLDRATIRYYEKEGLVVPRRQENGYRSYSADDVQLLLKIKLLRQLGVSLLKISSLQQGSGNFSEILEQQIMILEGQIQLNKQAKYVCQEIRNAGAQYSSLNASYYLQMLHNPSSQITQEYHEQVDREQHPIRRFAARMLDVTLLQAFITFTMIVVLRIRPCEDYLIVASFLSYFAYIPLEAALIHFWGTTPGKWAFGIRLEAVNGGKLTYSAAAFRSFSVVFAGCGLYIPILELWRFIKSYRVAAKGDELSWDEETEVVYTNWTIGRKAIVIVFAAICAALIAITSTDAALPRYRNDLLTAEEFCANFSFYKDAFDVQDNYRLEEDGSWTDTTDNKSEVIIIGGEKDHIRAPLQFDFRDGKVIAINYQDTWNDVTFLDTMPYYCYCAVYAITGSRYGMNSSQLISIGEQFETVFAEQFKTYPLENKYYGSLEFDDVVISWCIEMENAEFVHNGTLYVADGAKGTYTLDFNIKILE